MDYEKKMKSVRRSLPDALANAVELTILQVEARFINGYARLAKGQTVAISTIRQGEMATKICPNATG